MSSTLLDGLQDDLGMASTQLSPTLPATQRDVAEVHSQPVLTQLHSTVPASRGSLRRVGREVPTVDLTVTVIESNEEPFVALPRRRRLRLLGTQPTVPDPPTNRFSILEEVDSQVGASETDESDTESLVDPEFVDNAAMRPDPVRFEVRRNYQDAFVRLDEVNVNQIFETRAHVMKSVPFVMRGAFRRALRLAMDEVLEGWESHSVLRQERGWKLFLLIPRMLLSRPPRGGLIPRNKLESRLAAFAADHWIELINASGEMSWKAKGGHGSKKSEAGVRHEGCESREVGHDG